MRRSDEDLCRKCGRCCRVKLIAEDEVFVLPETCPHLDPETKLCRVYARRHRVNPQCADVRTGITARVFPEDCPYVADVRDYRGPIEVNCEDDVWKHLERRERRKGRRT